MIGAAGGVSWAEAGDAPSSGDSDDDDSDDDDRQGAGWAQHESERYRRTNRLTHHAGVACGHGRSIVVAQHARGVALLRMDLASVKDEIRSNAIQRIIAGQPLFAEVLGYGDTVFPQLENAILAGHDMIFLGERGQAKTRMIRSLVGLLDEWMPIVAGSEINDDPFAPVTQLRTRPRRRRRRRHAHRLGPSVRSLRREAGDARHLDRRPHRRGRPDQGGRGPLPLRRADASLRPGPADQPRASSRSTSSPISPNGSRSASSTCSRSATSRSAATRCGCRSMCSSSPRPTPRTTPTAAA